MLELNSYLSTQITKLGVIIELGKEVTPELVQKMEPEVVFIATGGRPFIPEIPGVEKQNVVTAVDLLLGRKEPGATVAVIGGGNVGCETALYLAQEGKNVAIVEVLDAVARDMHWLNRLHLLRLLADADVKIFTNTNILEITGEGVAIADEQGKRSTLECDTVVLALGFRPDGGLFQDLEGKVPEVYAVGDCVEPRKVMNAIWEGFRIARLL